MARVVYLVPSHAVNKYLGEALLSIDADPYGDKSILVVDNSSSSEMEMSYYCESLGLTTPVRVVRCHERGVSAALNFGIDQIDCEFIARMDSDDLVVPGRTQEQVDRLVEYRQYSGFGSCAMLVNENGDITGRLNMPKIASIAEMKSTLRIENPYIHPSMMMRAEVLRRFKYAAWGVNCEDWDLWVRLAKEGFLVGNLSGNYLKYRRHSNQVSVLHDYEERAAPLRRTLSVLDETLVQSYMFQRWYLERSRPTLRQLLDILVNEVPRLRNFYSAKKLISALGKAVIKNEA